uniref:PknH-like extracellular domain-containing protein n=1 Tax=Streptomyces sp. NBC_00049 TaxID=2903617 RepID=A0AAU2JVC3_9ACTN
MKARATMVALVPALLVAAVGCSSAGAPATGKDPDPKGSAGRASGAPGAPAASGAPTGSATPKTGGSRPERSALEQGDLAGYQISAQGKNPNAPDGQPQADKKVCQPLADIMGDKPDPAARETVNRGIGSQKQVGLAVSASVSSYAESDAKALIARLKAAVAACGAGFSATVEKQTGSYRDVKAAEFRTTGDESVSWTTTAAGQGVSAQVHLVVVREGDTVVRLMALNMAATQQKALVPQEVADKQLEKVQKTAG